VVSIEVSRSGNLNREMATRDVVSIRGDYGCYGDMVEKHSINNAVFVER
jgi:hypothetical protein